MSNTKLMDIKIMNTFVSVFYICCRPGAWNYISRAPHSLNFLNFRTLPIFYSPLKYRNLLIISLLSNGSSNFNPNKRRQNYIRVSEFVNGCVMDQRNLALFKQSITYLEVVGNVFTCSLCVTLTIQLSTSFVHIFYYRVFVVFKPVSMKLSRNGCQIDFTLM